MSGTARQATVVLVIVCAAQLILAVDVTVILVANVHIEDDLHFSPSGISWIFSAYALTFGGLLLLFGRLGDLVGHRRMFMLGMAAFGVASAGAAASASPVELVLSRAAQGIAAAAVSPAALALLADAFPAGRARTRAFGYWAAAGSAGGVIGYTVGGVLVGFLGWRSAFVVNIPIVVISMALGARFLPAARPSGQRERPPVAGALAVTAGVALLVLAVNRLADHGVPAGEFAALFGAAVVALAGFAAHELHAPSPLVPHSVFLRRGGLANIATAIQSGAIGAAVFLGSLYLQEGLGYTPQQVGIATLPVPIGVAIGAHLTTRLLNRYDCAKALIVGGLTLISGALFWIGTECVHHSYYAVLLPGWAVMGIGLAVASIPTVSMATAGATTSERGAVAGVFTMSQQLGSAFGVTALTLVATAHGSGALEHARRLHGLQVAMVVTAFVALGGLGYCALALPGRRRRPARLPAPVLEIASVLEVPAVPVTDV